MQPKKDNLLLERGNTTVTGVLNEIGIILSVTSETV